MAITLPPKRTTSGVVPPVIPAAPKAAAVIPPPSAPNAPLQPAAVPDDKTARDATAVRLAGLGQALTALTGDPVSHADSADGEARGKLSVGSTLTSAPSALGAPTPEARSATSHVVQSHGLYVAHDHVRPGSDGKPVDTAVMATVARANVGIDVARTVVGNKVVGGFSVENGYADVSSSLRWATADGGAATVGAFVGVTAGSLFVGGSGRIADAAGHTAALSAFGRVNANRTVRDLGDGTHGMRMLELKRSAGLGGVLAPGFVTGMLGVGGRLTVDKNRAVVLRTQVEPERARELLFEKRGVVGFFRDKGRALGLVEDPIQIPNPANPAELQTGDQLVISTSGSVLGGVALGPLGFRVGAEAITRGEFEVGVRKIDDTHVQLVVTPTEVKGLEVFLDTPLILEVRATRTQAASMRQAFTFDLSQPGALAAYKKALAGELPSGLGKAAALVPDAQKLADVVRREVLPSGVTRDFLEQAELHRSNVGAGLGWGIFEGGSLAGLSIARSTTDEKSVATNGKVAVDTRTRGVEKRREVLLSGTETSGVFASAHKVFEFDAQGKATQSYEGLSITARFSDDKVRGLELNSEVLDVLNEKMGTQLPHFTQRAHKESRVVTASRLLTEPQLTALMNLNPQRLSNAANMAGLTVADALTLHEELSASADVEAQAAAVQRFVAAHGIAGFGFIHRALPPPESLKVASTSSAYDTPLSLVETLAFKYPKPVTASDAPDAVVARLKDVKTLLRQTEAALTDAQHDVFLDDGARVMLTASLKKAQDKAQALFSLDRLNGDEKAHLRDAMERGWTTGDEQAVIDALDA